MEPHRGTPRARIIFERGNDKEWQKVTEVKSSDIWKHNYCFLDDYGGKLSSRQRKLTNE